MAAASFVREGEGFVDIVLRVTAGSSRDAIEGAETRCDGQARLKMRVRAVPEKGKANAAVIRLLAKAIGLPKSAFELVSGETSRDKVVRCHATEGMAEALMRLAG